jgi:hypothetical protein
MLTLAMALLAGMPTPCARPTTPKPVLSAVFLLVRAEESGFQWPSATDFGIRFGLNSTRSSVC